MANHCSYSWAEFLQDPVRLLGFSPAPPIGSGSRTREPFNRPVVFVSYRYKEAADYGLPASVDEGHQTWIESFVCLLESRNIDVIWDKRICKALGYERPPDSRFEFWSEVCRICPNVCDAFIPVITPGYMARLVVEEGTLGDEYLHASVCATAGNLAIIPVLRRWHADSIIALPKSLAFHGLYPLLETDILGYFQNFSRIVERVYTTRAARYSGRIHVSIERWLDLYIDWSRTKIPERHGDDVSSWFSDRWVCHSFLEEVDKIIKAAGKAEVARLERDWKLIDLANERPDSETG